MAVRRFLKYLPCQGAGAILSKPDGDGWRSSPESFYNIFSYIINR